MVERPWEVLRPPQRASPGALGLIPETLPWAAGQVVPGWVSQPLTTRLSCSIFLGSAALVGAGLRGHALPPRDLLATGSQGLNPHRPSKGLCATTKRLCPSQRSLGVAMVTEGAWEEGVQHLEGERMFQAEGTGAHRPPALSLTGQLPHLCLQGGVGPRGLMDPLAPG